MTQTLTALPLMALPLMRPLPQLARQARRMKNL